MGVRGAETTGPTSAPSSASPASTVVHGPLDAAGHSPHSIAAMLSSALRSSRLWPMLMLSLGASFGLGASCRRPPRPAPAAVAARPSIRLYFLADLDGYLEPCGCQSRPLGGIDRVAALLDRERAAHPLSLVVATGNLFFEHSTIETQMVFQERAKAESLGLILDGLGLAAYAPGPADYALGAEALAGIAGRTRAVPLLANVAGRAGTLVRVVGGVRVGLVGVSDFAVADHPPPAGAPATTDAVAAARAAVASLRGQVDVVVVLASVPRRVARTIAGEVPGVDFVVAARESSATAPPPERIGQAHLLTAVDQGKGLGAVDLYVRGDGAFQDSSDASAAAERARLDERLHALAGRIAAWEQDPATDRAAIAAQRARLAEMTARRATLDHRTVPTTGRVFDARSFEIAPEVPRAPAVQAQIATYFRAINERNRAEYATLRAPTAPPGTPHYVGIEACRDCHEDAYTVWARTPHSHAYRTLEDSSKNFNLSCVGCHVTGYRQPGGSEVVQNDGLRDVQCETCHGPGSAHVDARSDAARRATIRRDAPADLCATQCHTPEHSDHFDYATYRPRILGPGHGQPMTAGDAGAGDAAPATTAAAAH
jgi:2',3'-cyclic-nucleotide 2'-phosphodiesterase (5'-nucleotidase family)